jgi:phage-related tail fiber protein
MSSARWKPAAVVALLLATTAIASSARAADCVITDTVVTPNGVAVQGLRVEFRAVTPQSVNNSILASSPVVALTDVNGVLRRADGTLGVALLQGATVKVTSVGLGLRDATILVPNTSSAVLRTLIASYVAPSTAPAVDDATDLVMGLADNALTNILSGDTIAAAIVALNHAAGSGGGGPSNLAWKQPARVATTGSIAHSGLLTVDGVTLLAGDRVLDKDNSTATLRGVWVAASGSWSRATDFDESADLFDGAAVFVGEGSTYAGTLWQLTSNAPLTIDSSSLSFSLYFTPPSATTSTSGTVILATPSSDTTAGHVVQASDARLNDARTPTTHTHPESDVTNLVGDLAARLQLGGQLGGTATSPDVRGIRETAGPTLLTNGAIGDGQYLLRSGTTLIGGTLGSAALQNTSAFEVPLTFSTGLTRSTNTVTVNSTQLILKLSNLTSNGFVKTSGGDGTLGIDTATYLTANQTITASGDATGSGTTSLALTIANDAVTYAKLQNVSATDKCLGRVSASAGDVEEFTCTAAGRALIDDADAAAQRTTLGLGTLATQSGTFSGTSSGTNTGDQTITLTSDVTGSGTGSFATTIAADAVTNAKAANMAVNTVKCRITSGTGDPEDCTAANIRTIISAVSGSASEFMNGTGSFSIPAGGGGGGSVAWKDAVRGATTANITLSGTQTVDGVSLGVGDRELVKNQSTGSQNGIYVVASGAWTRATDMDTSAEAPSGMAVMVQEGTANADTGWQLTTNAAITLDTTALVFVLTDSAVSSSTPASIGTAAVGTGTTWARADHVHDLPFATLNSIIGTANASISVNTQKITNVVNPTSAQEAATKSYVDGRAPLWQKYYAANMFLPVGTSWPTTAMADFETYNLVDVIAYDPTTSQGRGFEVVLPTGATTVTIDADGAAAASGFTTNNGLVFALDCRQQYSTGSFTQQAATAVTISDNATIQRKSFAYTVSGLSATAGTVLLCEWERLTANASDTMTQDWRVPGVMVTVN